MICSKSVDHIEIVPQKVLVCFGGQSGSDLGEIRSECRDVILAEQKVVGANLPTSVFREISSKSLTSQVTGRPASLASLMSMISSLKDT